MKILVICGATASGKSELAVECARRLNGEIISCDAFLVYKRLNIGTAKPTEEEKKGIPHFLIDVAEPDENFSVSDFERRALPIVENVLARGKTPILCGGTGFYMNALLYAQSFGNVPASEEVRKKYEKIFQEKGGDYVHGLLKEVDPESAESLHVNDRVRVVRALEIFELTGKKKSDQHDEKIPRYPFVGFAYDYPRGELYARIERRVDGMIEAGLVEEVKELLESGVPEYAQSMQAIGYKEVVEYLKNGGMQSTMSDIIKKNTRNYAKRQLTFFKRTENLHWLKPSRVEEATEEIVKIYEN